MAERLRQGALNLILLGLVLAVPVTLLLFTDVPRLVGEYRPDWLAAWKLWVWRTWGGVAGLMLLVLLENSHGRWSPAVGRLWRWLLQNARAWLRGRGGKALVDTPEEASARLTGRGDFLPPLDLLGPPAAVVVRPCPDTAQQVKGALTALGIPGCEVVRHYAGPVVKVIQMRIPEATKASSVITLAGDLAAYLGARGVSVRPLVGTPGVLQLEVADRHVTRLSLRSLIDSREFRKAGGLPLIIAADGRGSPVVADLTVLPHLLIAGATGTGKTTLVRGLLTGLVYRLSPTELRLLLIDPKLVEFTLFRGLPHLLRDVITAPPEARDALADLVQETERRYRLFQQHHVTHIQAFNQKHPQQRLPYIVAVVDELAVLMESQVRKDIEAATQSLGQLARAAGIHLVLATQRPSVDVVTGLIKANIPARISLRLASQPDSRTVIDGAGAEQLRGQGDLLFRPDNETIRGQAAWVPEETVRRVVTWWKRSAPPTWAASPPPDATVITEPDPAGEEGMAPAPATKPMSREEQEILWAKERVLVSGVISRRIVERGLGISSARANALVRVLDDQGWLHPPKPPHPRQITLAPADRRVELAKLKGVEPDQVSLQGPTGQEDLEDK